MRRVRIRIEGVTPLLQDKALDELLNGVFVCHCGPHRPKTLLQQAAEKVYQQDGVIGLPAWMISGALNRAAQMVRLPDGRKPATKRENRLRDALTIEEQFFPFEGTPSWRVSNMKPYSLRDGLVILHEAVTVRIVRPRFDQWSFWMTIAFDEERLPETTLRKMIEVAGEYSGVGGFRPAHKGTFGQFRLADWQVLEDAQVA